MAAILSVTSPVGAPNPLHIANVERILGPAIARTFALELAMGLFLALGLLRRRHLAFGEVEPLLSDLGLSALSRFFIVSRS
jgi:hypothetical protein